MLPTLIKDKVDSIDIVELSQDVIDLVFHQVATEKMNIIHGEICHYLATTEKKYDLVCVDIWQNTFLPLWDIEGMKGLAQRCLKPGGTTWCWLEEMYRHRET
jgi:spermidine synthase